MQLVGGIVACVFLWAVLGRPGAFGATIPAAADIALAAGYASWSEARGAAFQLLLNVAVLMVMGALGLRVQRIIWGAREPAEASRVTGGRP